MDKTEDLWTPVETTTTTQTETTPEWGSDLDSLINDIANSNKTTPEPEQTTEPTNFVQDVKDNISSKKEETTPEEKVVPKEEPTPKEETTPEDKNDDAITEKDVKELDEAFVLIETENTNLKSEMDELQSLSTWYEDALTKLWNHPVLWPLNEKLLKWEEINIPKVLEKSHNEELDALPSLDKTTSSAKKPVWKVSLQDRLEKKVTQMH